ncbi:MAG: helix-turn-helix transcriptional regulator [Acidimicrobiales bacterium]
MPTIRHDDVREELLSELSATGRHQYEALGAVHEARQLTAQLAELRVAANLSQRQAAQRAGVDQADLSRIESGQITPSLPTLLRVLDVVGGTLVLARKSTSRTSAKAGSSPRAATRSRAATGQPPAVAKSPAGRASRSHAVAVANRSV